MKQGPRASATIGIAFLSAVFSLGSLPLSAVSFEAERELCFGKQPTKVGTEGKDYLRSKPDVHDVIMGLGGKDYISGGVGDRICGGPGDDIVSGARFLSGDQGNDYMVGKKGPNLFIGGHGNDRADLQGGGQDVVRGGPGSDRVDAPSQRIDRGDNEIIVNLAEGFITSIQTERTRIYSIERATTCTSRSRAKIYGTDGRNSLLSLCEGGATIYGRGGNDLLWGGNERRDRIFGGPGDDLIRGRGGDDYLDGGSGTDACYGGETVVRCE